MNHHSFFNEVKEKIIKLFRSHPYRKIRMILNGNMERYTLTEVRPQFRPAHFHSKNDVNLPSTNLEDLYQRMVEKIFESICSYNKEGFYKFGKVIKLDIHMVDYIPLRGSSYIPLPKYLADKKAIINMQNEDNQCFKWCVARALNPVKRGAERITKILRVQADELNWDGITFSYATFLCITFPTDTAIEGFENQKS